VTLSTTQYDNVTILIMTLLIMMILVTHNMGYITYNDILITLISATLHTIMYLGVI
jgi:hypothetical protein